MSEFALIEIKPEPAPMLYITNGLDVYLEQICQTDRAGVRKAAPSITSARRYQSRNTDACWSLAAGANPNFIAKQMGHTDAQMVYRVYGSWMAENNQDQVLILNQKLSEFAPSMPHAVGSDGY